MTTTATASSGTRLFAFIGLLAVGGLPTFVVAVVLGSIGVSFVASGLAVYAAGLMAAAGILPMNDNPIKAILVGPPLAAIGSIALVALILYFWLAVKVARKVLAL